jgi:hypothetical protein
MSDDPDIDKLSAEAEQATKAASQLLSHGAHAGAVVQPWNPWLISFLTIVIIAFSVLVLYFMRIMLKDGHRPNDILRLTTMPMVIAAAIFLVLLGYSNNQITSVIGLLGTLIGYILGSATSKGTTPADSPSPSPSPSPPEPPSNPA